MRAIVTGSTGQVASALAVRAAHEPNQDLTFLARPQFDLEAPDELAREIRRQVPDVVLSVAAYTAVDTAETERQKAMTINGDAPGALSAAAADLDIPIVHLSTDYVFSGTGNKPFVETDRPDPVTQYGRSKLSGEEAVAHANPKHIILRTAWVYSPFGKNFAKTMLSLAETREQISVVADQVGNPTSAFDIADGIIRVLQKLRSGVSNKDMYGIYHMAGADEASWFAFAKEIFSQSASVGGPTAEVVPVDSSAFPTAAKRPANSRLDCSKFEKQFDHPIPGYKEALRDVVAALLIKS